MFHNKKYGFYTVVSIVIANIVGTGVFTSLGFQVMDLKSGIVIISLWLIGGIAALFGAYSYAELGAAMPRSGGEYHFLSRLYHPAVGFLAGWVSITVGFSAAIAAASMAFGSYFYSSLPFNFPELFIGPESVLAITALLGITFIQAFSRVSGAVFQKIITLFKIILIVVFIYLGFFMEGKGDIDFTLSSNAFNELFSPSFAIALFFVSYSYSGWNAAAYITDEIDNAKKNLPRSLIIGTFIVIALYGLLNYSFLRIVPIAELKGKIEIGLIFGRSFFQNSLGSSIGLLFSFLLLSTISSMVISGPRVTQVMGEDYKIFSFLSVRSSKGIPIAAIFFQSGLSILYIVTASFEQVIVYMGFTLNLFCLLTVIGLIIHRIKFPEIERPFKSFGYPYIQLFFIVFNTWLLVYGLIYRTVESLIGLATVLSGLLFYFLGGRKVTVK